MDSFRALLDRSNISLRSQWRKVQQQLEGESAFRALEKIDRLAVFEEFVRVLETKDDQVKQKEKEEQRRHDRKKRDAFRARLTEEHDAGRITYRTQWADVADSLAEAEGYRAALAQPGGTPLELFEDFVDQLAQTFAAQAKAVRVVLARRRSSHPPSRPPPRSSTHRCAPRSTQRSSARCPRRRWRPASSSYRTASRRRVVTRSAPSSASGAPSSRSSRAPCAA